MYRDIDYAINYGPWQGLSHNIQKKKKGNKLFAVFIL